MEITPHTYESTQCEREKRPRPRRSVVGVGSSSRRRPGGGQQIKFSLCETRSSLSLKCLPWVVAGEILRIAQILKISRYLVVVCSKFSGPNDRSELPTQLSPLRRVVGVSSVWPPFLDAISDPVGLRRRKRKWKKQRPRQRRTASKYDARKA